MKLWNPSLKIEQTNTAKIDPSCGNYRNPAAMPISSDQSQAVKWLCCH
jgi:hypothetical protein